MIASLPTVSTAELKKRLQHIVGERSPFSSPRQLAAVENYIEKGFESYGLSVESDTFTYWGRSYRNVIGRAGPARNGPLIILGAHYDSVEGSPGADDNGSGVGLEQALDIRFGAQVELLMAGNIHKCTLRL